MSLTVVERYVTIASANGSKTSADGVIDSLMNDPALVLVARSTIAFPLIGASHHHIFGR